MTIEELVDKHYDELFQELVDNEGDDFYNITIEVVTMTTGKTIRRSWRDRENILKEQNE